MMLSKENCPKGTECGVHYRLSDHVLGSMISLIDYVGEYAVFTQTTDNLTYYGSVLKGKPIDAVTQVYRIGDKAIADVIQNATDLARVQVSRREISVPFDQVSEMADEEAKSYFENCIKIAHSESLILADLGKFDQ